MTNTDIYTAALYTAKEAGRIPMNTIRNFFGIRSRKLPHAKMMSKSKPTITPESQLKAHLQNPDVQHVLGNVDKYD